MKSRSLYSSLLAVLVLVLMVSCDSLLGSDDDSGSDDVWDGGQIPLGADVDYRISAGDGAYEIHSFTTDGAGDYRITVSRLSGDATLLWYLFDSESDAVDYHEDTNIPDLVIAEGNIVGENPQTDVAEDLSGDTTYYLGIESFGGTRGVGSDYTVNVSAAD